jgi:hypothetical protein
MTWLVLLSALWLVLSPFVLGMTGTPAFLWNNLLIGLAVAALLLWGSVGKGRFWLTALMGAYLVMTPYFFGFSSAGALWNNLIVGAVLAVASYLAATQTHTTASG